MDVLARFDWNQARAFLATAEHGSLSAAARVLGLTQPTLSRQVAALEADLGVLLFDRIGKTLVLTQPGRDLLDHVRSMGKAAERMALSASGQAQTVEGRVCITASDVVSAYHLPPILASLRTIAPRLDVQVLAANDIRDLQRREADIAIRHVRSTTGELIAKLVRETTAHIYGAPSYLRSIGNPARVEDLSKAGFIGFDPLEQMIGPMTERGIEVTEANFPYIANNGVFAWEMAKAGLGLCVMTREVGDMTPEVRIICPDMAPFEVPVWLTTHRELHTSRRIRVVFDHLAEGLANL